MPPLVFNLAAASDEFKLAWKEADNLIKLEAPQKWISEDGFQRWVSDIYNPWLESRTHAIANTRIAEQKAKNHPVEGPIASAIVGFVVLQTHQEIREIELPTSVENSEELDTIAKSIEAPLPALNDLGHKSYQMCAKHSGPTELSAWIAHCKKRIGLLPASQSKTSDEGDNPEIHEDDSPAAETSETPSSSENSDNN